MSLERNTGQPALACDGLTVRYGRRVAVDDLSLEVERGTVYALLGRNGAGKTSAIRCLLGLQKADGGRIGLLGADPWKKRARLMQRVGVVPEQPDAPPDLTPKQLTKFCARLYRTWDQDAALTRLAKLRVPEKVAFKNLSRGQKTQTLLTLALGHNPELLVLDDPSLGLDAVAKKDLVDELSDYMADRAASVFITTHDLYSVEGLADRIGIMRQTHLLVDEPAESLKARFRLLRYRLADGVEPGPELAGFQVVDRPKSSWGHEAIVSNFTEEAFAGLAGHPGLESAAHDSLPLEGIFCAVAGDNNNGEGVQ
ncbi:MAG: ABC transporter ATP-binding protein [Thermoanaerobaculia bacterium]